VHADRRGIAEVAHVVNVMRAEAHAVTGPQGAFDQPVRAGRVHGLGELAGQHRERARRAAVVM